MTLANVIIVNLIPTDGGFLDKLFHQSWIALTSSASLGPMATS